MEISFQHIDLRGFFDIELAVDNFPFILGGLSMTVSIAIIGMLVGLILGLLLAVLRNSKNIVARWPARMFISLMRGTPMLVFLFILYFGLPMVGIKLTAYVAACAGFGLNSSAYIAEINRASLNSVDKGQWESARALNMSYVTSLFKIILPQATRIAVPPLTNVFMDIVKATSLAAVITIPEMFQKAQIAAGREFDSMTFYILIAIIYWVICVCISFIQDRLEIRFSKYI